MKCSAAIKINEKNSIMTTKAANTRRIAALRSKMRTSKSWGSSYRKGLPPMKLDEAVAYLKKAIAAPDAANNNLNRAIRALLEEHVAATAPKTCNGCVENGLWEDELEYGYDCPCIYCTRIAGLRSRMRNFHDNYRRSPEPGQGGAKDVV